MNAQQKLFSFGLVVGLLITLPALCETQATPPGYGAGAYGAHAGPEQAQPAAPHGPSQAAPPPPPAPPAPKSPKAPSATGSPAEGMKHVGKMVDDTGSTNALLPATPLFAASKAGTGEVKQEKVMPRKEMFAKTENEERRAREIVARIDTVKSTQLSEYLKLDKELDGKYEDIGLARGHAADDILDIKEALWAEVLERNHVNADDALQGSIAATKKKLDALEEEVKRLTEREGDVVARLKELSDETMGAFDKAAQMFNKRSELPGIINDQTAQMIFDQIKGAPDAIADIEKGLTKPEGVVPRLDKAIADARAQMNVVTGMLTDLEKEDVDVAGKIAETEGHDKAVREEQVAAEESGDIVEHTVEETTVAPKKKRSKKSKESWIPDWVSTDLFHKAYAAVAGFGSACWEVVRPVRIMCMKIYTHLTRKLFGNKGEQAAAVALKVKDPVLARIEIERQQSQKKVNDLSQQRHLIREKEELLDRLEVERVMQLERKDEVAAQLDRSYRRGARKELSWFDLGKRFVWKAYGSFRRGMSRLAQWWQEARAEVSGKAVVDKKPVAKPQQSEEVVVQTDVSPQKASEEVSTQASEEVSEFDALYMDDEAEESEDDDSDAMMMEDDMQGDEYAEEGVSVEDAVKQAVAGREEKLTVTEKAAKAFADGSGDKAQLAADMMMSKDEQDVAAQRAQKLAAEASAAVKAAQASVAQVTAKTAK